MDSSGFVSPGRPTLRSGSTYRVISGGASRTRRRPSSTSARSGFPSFRAWRFARASSGSEMSSVVFTNTFYPYQMVWATHTRTASLATRPTLIGQAIRRRPHGPTTRRGDQVGGDRRGQDPAITVRGPSPAQPPTGDSCSPSSASQKPSHASRRTRYAWLVTTPSEPSWDERILAVVPSGIDDTIVVENLRRTPTERVENLQRLVDQLEALRGKGA